MAEVHKNHWEKELEKESLKEPQLKSKFTWKNPMTHMHALEFRGKKIIKLTIINN